MNPQDAADTDTPVPESPQDTPAAAEPAPKRKRAPRAKAAATSAAETAADVATASTVPGPVETVVVPTVPGAVPDAVMQALVPTAAAIPAVRPEAAAVAPAGVGMGAGGREAGPDEGGARDGSGESSASSASTASGSAAPETGEGGESAGAGESGELGESGEPRRRNRRRGRRRGERAERTDAAAPVGGAAVEAASANDAADAARTAAGAGADVGPAMPLAAALPPTDPAELFAEVLSGAFDAEPAAAEAAAPALPPKRVLLPEPDAPKLHKVLAQSGVGSRRDMEQMIAEGRITVNGQPAHTGQRISFGDRIAVDGKPIRVRIAPPPPRVLAYHKPVGEVVTHDDPQQRPTVFRRLPRLPQGKWQSVGRLDINTEGLLLFTNSGELANQLMHPRFAVEREYAVRSLGVLAADEKARLLEGVEIEGQRCAFQSIEDGGGEGVNHWYRVVITEGRNREVRRLFEAAGHAVSRLIRIRYGCVVLPRGLRRGVWVDLGEQDLRALRRLTQPVAARGEGARDGAREVPREGAREGPREPQRGAERDSEDGRNRRNRRGRRGRDGRDPVLASPGNVALPATDTTPPDDFEDRDPRQPSTHLSPLLRERAPKLRGPRSAAERAPRPEAGEGGAIPNPLQQTYDKRALMLDRAQSRDLPEDGPIPNPLQQTYDKRALQKERMVQRDIPDDAPIPNPMQQTYDKRFAQGARGGGNGISAAMGARGPGRGGPARKKAGRPGADGPRQPDPLQTAVGYIGADAFLRKGGKGGKPGKPGGGPKAAFGAGPGARPRGPAGPKGAGRSGGGPGAKKGGGRGGKSGGGGGGGGGGPSGPMR